MPAPKRPPAKAPAHERIPVEAGVETWRNTMAGKVGIARVGEYGRRMVDVVHGGRTFQITPQERRMNQASAANAELDFFTNGTLAPVALIDGEPDTEALRANPNTLAEQDLPKLFQLRGDEFADRIGRFTSLNPVSRLVELARDPAFDATLSQYEALKARELELRGSLDERPAPPPAPATADAVPRGVTPR